MSDQRAEGPQPESVVDRNGGDVVGGAPSPAAYTYDLTTKERPRIPEGQLVAVAPFEQTILGRQEWVRTALAVGAFSSLVAVLAFLLGSVYKEVTIDNIEKVATVVVTPLTGIVGTIIGFYFAERRSGGTREPTE
jgi:hypothetical protein